MIFSWVSIELEGFRSLSNRIVVFPLVLVVLVGIDVRKLIVEPVQPLACDTEYAKSFALICFDSVKQKSMHVPKLHSCQNLIVCDVPRRFLRINCFDILNDYANKRNSSARNLQNPLHNKIHSVFDAFGFPENMTVSPTQLVLVNGIIIV